MAPAPYRFIADRFHIDTPAISDENAQGSFVETLGRCLHSIQRINSTRLAPTLRLMSRAKACLAPNVAYQQAQWELQLSP
jgi:hypothetical protein